MANWKVTVYGCYTDEDYDSPDGVIAEFALEDCTEAEANEEARHEIWCMGDEVADWTMMEIA